MSIQLSLSLHFYLLYFLLKLTGNKAKRHVLFYSVDCWWLWKKAGSVQQMFQVMSFRLLARM